MCCVLVFVCLHVLLWVRQPCFYVTGCLLLLCRCLCNVFAGACSQDGSYQGFCVQPQGSQVSAQANGQQQAKLKRCKALSSQES